MIGVVRRTRGEHEQPLAPRLAQEGDRVGRHVHVANAARGRACRSSGAARRAPAPAARNVVSHVSSEPQGIVRRASSPQAPSSPSSSPANSIGTPGVVICRPTPTRCRSGVPAIVRKRATSWLSSRFQECSAACHGHAGSELAHRRDGCRAVELRDADRDAPELLLLLGVRIVPPQPRPERAHEAGVVHDAVPAAHREVGAEVVSVLGDEQVRRRSARASSARRRG